MERKVFLGRYLVWVIIVLGHILGCKSCIDEEKNALLELKTYLASQSSQPDLINTFDYFYITWKDDTMTDCCEWEGVKCNLTSGRVTGLTLNGATYLPKRALLNLSLLHPFAELQTLNLSFGGYATFGGLFDDVEGYKSFRRLPKLEILDFTLNEFNNSIFPFVNAATSLTSLFLRGNTFAEGPFPFKELKDLTDLELLDLSNNGFNGSVPVRELSALRKVKVLDLSGNGFSGSMEAQGICEMRSIQELDLSNNELEGQFPLCLTRARGLRVLDLSSNQLSGKLPSALGSLESLEYLSLSDNNFEGFFSFGLLANLSKLKVFKLSSKSNSIQVELDGFWKPKFQLSIIVLQSCNLEKVPQFLLHQKDLRQVDLSNNKISGRFPSWLLANNTKLQVLLLQNNSFMSFQLPGSSQNLLFLDVSVNEFNHLIPENIGWMLPNLRYMNLAENDFQGFLPSSLGNMKRIEYLDISHNSLSGNLPISFLEGCYSLRILKLSHNKLSGEILPRSANFTELFVLSIDNNLFAGKIGQGLRKLTNLGMLDISNNNLTGVIPSWIGELSSLTALLLSNNLLEGEIPISLFNISSLAILDLSANFLSGDIPPYMNSTIPVVLLLPDNNLSGVIPDTLLENVSILDLRNNRLSGNIPKFINTQNISVLLLRGNNLTGPIPRQLCGLSNVHLLDLANNRLNGSIPSCLSNISFGLAKEDTYLSYDYNFAYSPSDVLPSPSTEQNPTSPESIGIYFKSLLLVDTFSMDYLAGTQTKIEFATKYRYDAYMDGNLVSFSGLDLSQNELSGDIPVQLGGLPKLHALNFSHNYLSGVIPESFSSMTSVESLDISFNRLQGRIPPQLTELSSLAVFNVSFNNLSGVIPQGRQFNTFDARSYLGNPLLCGQPTNLSCNGDISQEPDNEVADDESTIDMESFYWSFGAAYLTILIGLFASLSFVSPWSRFWLYIVDAFIHKVTNL